MAQNFNIGSSYNNDYLTKYFSGNKPAQTNNQSNGLEGLVNQFGDYNSIKNGSYKKLVSAYYNKEKTENVSIKSAEKNSTIINYKNIQSSATGLKAAAKELQKASLYLPEIKESKDPATGKIKVYEELDFNKISKAVNSFADSYNKMIDVFDNTNNAGIQSKANYMIKFTQANQTALSRIGINIGEDNKLSVDNDKLNQAGAASVKSVFQGMNSYGWSIGDKANQIEGLSKNSVNKMSRLYDGQGNYRSPFNTDSIINDYF